MGRITGHADIFDDIFSAITDRLTHIEQPAIASQASARASRPLLLRRADEYLPPRASRNECHQCAYGITRATRAMIDGYGRAFRHLCHSAATSRRAAARPCLSPKLSCRRQERAKATPPTLFSMRLAGAGRFDD